MQLVLMPKQAAAVVIHCSMVIILELSLERHCYCLELGSIGSCCYEDWFELHSVEAVPRLQRVMDAAMGEQDKAIIVAMVGQAFAKPSELALGAYTATVNSSTLNQ